MRGEVKELAAKAAVAADADPAGRPVYEEIQRLAQKFDVRAIRLLLQGARQFNA